MPLTIGQVAAGADVNVQTIRYYERRGLVPRAARSAGGYRQYGPEAVARLRFIKRAQELGFSLAEVKELLSLRVKHGAACEQVEHKARAKIARVEQKLRELEQMKRVLERLVASCRRRTPTADCPILGTLEERTPA